MNTNIYELVDEFRKKYPLTIGWRRYKHAKILIKHLNNNEHLQYVFFAQNNNTIFNIWQSCVVGLTNKRILIARKNIIVGYLLSSVTPDLFNDLQVSGGIFWGRVHIDTIKEFITLSNIDKRALPEIESNISSFMIEQKKKYYQEKNGDDNRY